MIHLPFCQAVSYPKMLIVISFEMALISSMMTLASIYSGVFFTESVGSMVFSILYSQTKRRWRIFVALTGSMSVSPPSSFCQVSISAKILLITTWKITLYSWEATAIKNAKLFSRSAFAIVTLHERGCMMAFVLLQCQKRRESRKLLCTRSAESTQV